MFVISAPPHPSNGTASLSSSMSSSAETLGRSMIANCSYPNLLRSSARSQAAASWKHTTAQSTPQKPQVRRFGAASSSNHHATLLHSPKFDADFREPPSSPSPSSYTEEHVSNQSLTREATEFRQKEKTLVFNGHDHKENKDTVVRYFHSIARASAIDADGLYELRAALAKALGVPESAFGDLREQFLRFDCDGDGKLSEQETLMWVKCNLMEFSRKLGNRKSSLMFPTTSLAGAGYRLMEEIGHGNQSKVHLAKDHRDMRCCVKTYTKTDMDWQGVEMLKDECDVLCNLATH